MSDGFSLDPEGIAEGVNNILTHSEIEVLCGVLAHAAEGCDYAAEDYAYRQSFEDSHPRSDGDGECGYADAAEAYSETSGQLAEIIEALRKRDAELQEED